MGSDLNLPKSLTQLSAPPPPQAVEQSQKSSNMPMLYYGLVVVATAAIVLAVYNLLIVRWCTNQYQRRSSREEANNEVVNFRRTSNNSHHPQSSSSLSHSDSSTIGLSSFRYIKKGKIEEEESGGQLLDIAECSVCLSVFEEGEQVRKLPRCNHWFHAECIDMWLYSHADCPLCRASVVVVVVDHPSSADDSQNQISRPDGLLSLDTST